LGSSALIVLIQVDNAANTDTKPKIAKKSNNNPFCHQTLASQRLEAKTSTLSTGEPDIVNLAAMSIAASC
jgi:hypothetical protein